MKLGQQSTLNSLYLLRAVPRPNWLVQTRSAIYTQFSVPTTSSTTPQPAGSNSVSNLHSILCTYYEQYHAPTGWFKLGQQSTLNSLYLLRAVPRPNWLVETQSAIYTQFSVPTTSSTTPQPAGSNSVSNLHSILCTYYEQYHAPTGWFKLGQQSTLNSLYLLRAVPRPNWLVQTRSAIYTQFSVPTTSSTTPQLAGSNSVSNLHSILCTYYEQYHAPTGWFKLGQQSTLNSLYLLRAVPRSNWLVETQSAIYTQFSVPTTSSTTPQPAGSNSVSNLHSILCTYYEQYHAPTGWLKLGQQSTLNSLYLLRAVPRPNRLVQTRSAIYTQFSVPTTSSTTPQLAGSNSVSNLHSILCTYYEQYHAPTGWFKLGQQSTLNSLYLLRAVPRPNWLVETQSAIYTQFSVPTTSSTTPQPAGSNSVSNLHSILCTYYEQYHAPTGWLKLGQQSTLNSLYLLRAVPRPNWLVETQSAIYTQFSVPTTSSTTPQLAGSNSVSNLHSILCTYYEQYHAPTGWFKLGQQSTLNSLYLLRAVPRPNRLVETRSAIYTQFSVPTTSSTTPQLAG